SVSAHIELKLSPAPISELVEVFHPVSILQPNGLRSLAGSYSAGSNYSCVVSESSPEPAEGRSTGESVPLRLHSKPTRICVPSALACAHTPQVTSPTASDLTF